ncbi:nitrite reductase small subunit NirD [Paenibacillus sp. YYML68]|uniref:nitrite reductase small subunit NirD n=1 Tax=Paenibacillus sp. YYML68 TaxID=2909250 RepID=UPI0024935A7E|nr:nitrite reductase small subunit NirD [Paenibacillus sp. YYML68]
MNRIIVGHMSDIMEKRSRVVVAGGKEIAIFKLSTGELKAIENKCPHKGGKLSEGILCDHHVFCPLHDWKIDVNDGLVQAPDEGCVETFRIEVEEGGLLALYLNEVDMAS